METMMFKSKGHTSHCYCSACDPPACFPRMGPSLWPQILLLRAPLGNCPTWPSVSVSVVCFFLRHVTSAGTRRLLQRSKICQKSKTKHHTHMLRGLFGSHRCYFTMTHPFFHPRQINLSCILELPETGVCETWRCNNRG